MNPIRLTAPFTDADTLSELTRLNAGDRVLISGTVFTARDAAHKKMIELLDGGGTLPFDPAGAVIYYVGPTPAPPGLVIGSAGPTTASRMDAYTPKLLSLGVKGVIGKGYRSEAVRKSLIENRAVYFAATGGAGILLSKRILTAEVIAFPELGTEAVRKLIFSDFPATVITDFSGNYLYETGPKAWRKNNSIRNLQT